MVNGHVTNPKLEIASGVENDDVRGCSIGSESNNTPSLLTTMMEANKQVKDVNIVTLRKK